MPDNEYDPDEQPPPPDNRPRQTALLPRVSFQDFTPWETAGFTWADDDSGEGEWGSLHMPPGWELRDTAAGVQLLWDGGGRPKFLVLASGLVPVTEEEAARYA